jgi:hypothetical protein
MTKNHSDLRSAICDLRSAMFDVRNSVFDAMLRHHPNKSKIRIDQVLRPTIFRVSVFCFLFSVSGYSGTCRAVAIR